jgi:sarcosine oxidase subunit beta
MRRYSAFAIAREAARHHQGWERAWRLARAQGAL